MTDALHPSTHLRAAAWVPNDDPNRPWNTALDLAAAWLWERSRAENQLPVLVTNTKKAGEIRHPDLDRIIRSGRHATPQGSTRCEGSVLAFVPNERSLHFAINLARGYSLVVIEGRSLPLAEWAANAEATNLLTGQTTAPQISEDVRRDLDFVILDGGRNGWTGPDEKTYAQRCLSDHIRSGSLTPDEAAAYALTSASVSDSGAKRLRELLAHNR